MRLTRAAAHGEIGPVQLDVLERIVQEALGRDNAPALSSLERSDLEDEVAIWLEDRGGEARGRDRSEFDAHLASGRHDGGVFLYGPSTNTGCGRKRGTRQHSRDSQIQAIWHRGRAR